MNAITRWTDEARAVLDEWLAAREPGWIENGADPAEVRGDIVADLERRFEASPRPVGPERLRQVLALLDSSQAEERPADEAAVRRPRFLERQPDPARSEGSVGRRLFAGTWKSLTTSLWWTVLWPAGVVLFEWATRFCGTTFFNPLPTWKHLVLIVAACAAGLLVNRTRAGGLGVSPKWTGAARGFGLVVAGWWSVLLLPVLLIGTFAYGFGVVASYLVGLVALPVFLALVLVTAAPLLVWAGLFRKPADGLPRRWQWGGALAGLMALLAVEGPPVMTRMGVAADSPAMIRTFGSEEALLRMCYEGTGGRFSGTDTIGWLENLLHGRISAEFAGVPEDNEAIRTMYYRVTGTPFNAARPPSDVLANGRGRFSDVTFDDALGGDGVSARLPDLDLVSSRLDGHLDPASGLGYCEWTMVFKNHGPRPREARMQVLLPPQGVVSRLTLWVNGEPQEAAFSSTGKVTQAYRSIAVERGRDPVLVRWVAPDRVLVQCFPVPARGEMKIRVGITGPLDKQGRFQFPELIEQNFGFRDGLATDVWFQGNLPLSVRDLGGSSQAGDWHEVHGKLPLDRQAGTFARTGGGSPPGKVWTRDPFAPPSERILVREPAGPPSPAEPQPLVLVLDGSAALGSHRRDLAAAFQELTARGHRLEVIAATERGTVEGGASLPEEIRFAGGVDNQPALERAFEIAAAAGAPQVIWLHGPQPVDFGNSGALAQRIERNLRPISLVAIDLAGGPNRLLEKIGPHPRVRGGGRPPERDDLLDAILAANAPVTRDRWTRLPADAVPDDAVEVWDHLARWNRWLELIEAAPGPGRADAAGRAAKYQLVTPWSGAVVLETAEQYREFGLEQVDSSAVPGIPAVPEPSSLLLLLISTGLIWRRQRPER